MKDVRADLVDFARRDVNDECPEEARAGPCRPCRADRLRGGITVREGLDSEDWRDWAMASGNRWSRARLRRVANIITAAGVCVAAWPALADVGAVWCTHEPPPIDRPAFDSSAVGLGNSAGAALSLNLPALTPREDGEAGLDLSNAPRFSFDPSDWGSLAGADPAPVGGFGTTGMGSASGLLESPTQDFEPFPASHPDSTARFRVAPHEGPSNGNGEAYLEPVPEPSSALLAGIAALWLARRPRQPHG